MKTKLSNVWIGIQAAAALCTIGAVKLWAPVCGKLLTLESGKEVPMKCFYTGQAATAVAVILLVTALLALLAKKDHKKFMLINAVCAVMLFLLFGSLIGICASPEMRCHTTAFWCRGAAVVTLVTSAIELISGKDGQVPS
ncbi:MAG: DUF4418 family protein [Oscillospiraceae bacterium]|nr:DUF4418 family protein [Oscillospiraceae bacterium]